MPLHLVKALSAWCFFILHTDFAIDDPRSERLQLLRTGVAPMGEKLIGILDCVHINPQTCNNFEDLCRALGCYLKILDNEGIRALLAERETSASQLPQGRVL